MADDPMTLASVTSTTIREGLVLVEGLASGPADYDATNGASMDVSSYVTAIKGGIDFTSVTAKADALVYPTYVNDDMTDADGGAVYFTWSPAKTGDAENAEIFDNVADTTDLSDYQWTFSILGTPPSYG